MAAAKLWTWWDTRTSKHKNNRDSNSTKPLFVKSTGPFIKKNTEPNARTPSVVVDIS